MIQKNYYFGFDWLRAIMSVFVVISHTVSYRRSAMYDIEAFELHSYVWTDFINFNLILLAVPVFIYISMFLFFTKKQTVSTLFNQVKFLGAAAVFWTLLFYLWPGGYLGFKRLLPHSVGDFFEIFFTSGHTIYYFFIVLMVLKFVAFFVQRFKDRSLIIGLILSLVMLAILPGIAIYYQSAILTAYWNPLNFIPYVFAGALAARYYQQAKTNIYVYGLLVLLAIGFFSFEWNYYRSEIYFIYEGMGIPAYTRVSLIFASTALILLSLNIQKKSNRLITFMSENSFGLYVLHLFFLPLVMALFESVFGTGTGYYNYAVWTVTFLMCYVLSVLLKKYVLNSWVFQ